VEGSQIHACNLSLTKKDIHAKDRMVIPRIHQTNSTKNSWIAFYNEDAEEYLVG
jgi:hypothetical protein